MNEIINYISQYGFPTVMCILLLWYQKEEISKFTDALNANTIVLQKLCDKMDIEREKK